MNRPQKSYVITPEIERQASEWLSVIQSDQVSPRERQAFMAWLDADARHCTAYNEVDALWQDLAQLTHLRDLERPQADSLRGGFFVELKNWMDSRRARLSWGLGVAVAFLLLIVFVPQSDRREVAPLAAEYATDVGEIRQIALSDGSTMVLGAKSTASVTYGKNRRRVVLSGGEAFFSVSRDAFRPFIVMAGKTEVRVTGTQFEVRYGADAVRVGVAEGRVEVSVAELTGERRALRAGDQLVASEEGVLAPTQPIAVDRIGVWREGQLIYDTAPLRELIADARRYYPGSIMLADTSLGELSVTAVFRADDIPQMLNSLAVTHSVDIEWGEDGSVLIKAHAAENKSG